MWPAYAVVLGGCIGDALWALLVGLGAGMLLRVAEFQDVFGAISVALLVVLGGLFLRRAWRRFTGRRADVTAEAPSAFDSSKGSFMLGLTLAATGPWNLAFWLAVLGQAGADARGFVGSLVIASGVLAGAATWGLILCLVVTKLGVRFARPSWDILTQLATGVLMLYFAARTAARLLEA